MKKQFLALLSVALLTTPVAMAEEALTPVEAPATLTPAALENALQGQVTETVTTTTTQETTTVVTPVSKIEVSATPGETGKYSSNKYSAVTYVVKNNTDQHVEVLQGEVVNAIDEQIAAQAKAESSATKKRIAGGFLRAATSIPLGFAGVGGLGYGAYSALAHTANATSYVANAIENTPNGGTAITGSFVKQVRNVIVAPKQTFTFTALLPKGAQGQSHFIVKNLQTNEIYEVNK